MAKSLVSRIEVTGLFGKYSYVLPTVGDLSSPAILYGDNGVGKSTILKILFHLLSPADDRGHRTSLYNIPFAFFSATLMDGSTVTAEKVSEKEYELLVLRILTNKGEDAEWIYAHASASDEEESFLYHLSSNFMMSKPQSKVRLKTDSSSKAKKEYLDLLGRLVPRTYYVNADRRLDSDAIEDAFDDIQRKIIFEERKQKFGDILQSSRAYFLDQALKAAHQWVYRQAVRSANQGSENVHSVYEGIVSQIKENYDDEIRDSNTDVKQMLNALQEIDLRTKSYSFYELSSHLNTEPFSQALRYGTHQSRRLSAKLIKPYIESVQGRLRATEGIYCVLDLFVTTINSFLTAKNLRYTLSEGFQIVDATGNKLTSNQLSSGEQQLLLIFSYVLTSRSEPSVFIIDEPEISLNIKWQRRLINSLLEIADANTVQFIFASHSLELLAQHRNTVVKLEAR